ncbi:peptidoglycan-binding domain-containing protein [uncultured Microbacterium sp.]|uniref:peptidoglycan-binding domain-containing protein n=1 Tax=uncultured Microbacterium sp. TaxID=191216 RepID=UPI0025F459AE|nr:peptidoglycan-binding domain-containing protein [uncultured Microbacterium sp.]
MSWIRWASCGALLLVAGAAIAWAGFTVLRPAEDPLASAVNETTAVVTKGQVGEALTVNTSAQWQTTPAGANRAAGIVTSLSVTAGQSVAAGDTVYSVGLRPVAVGAGTIPMFRDVGRDLEGPDVAQVQQMLSDIGLYRNAIDGQVGVGTEQAIKTWQKKLGVEQTGVVQASDVIFLPTLPARVALSTDIAVGASLAGGEPAISVLPEAPDFTVSVAESQAALIADGMRVDITAPDGGTWQAHVAGRTRDASNALVSITLSGPDAREICADACPAIPITGQSQLLSKVILQEPVTGMVIPSAALQTDASGKVEVVLEDGQRVPVTVTASARGQSVVQELSEGQRVKVSASASR